MFASPFNQSSASAAAPASAGDKASDDLLQLSGANPFASVLSAAGGGGGGGATNGNAAAAATGASPFAAEFSNANGERSRLTDVACLSGL